MKKSVIGFVALLVFYGCKQKADVSGIEVIKLDSALLNEIKQSSDSVKMELRDKKPQTKIYTYYKGKDHKDIVFIEGEDTIVAISRRENNITYYVREYYSNGQIKGKINHTSDGKINGLAKYYYADGRIRSIGVWENYKMIGIWKDYDEQGKLVSVYDHDKKKYILPKSY